MILMLVIGFLVLPCFSFGQNNNDTTGFALNGAQWWEDGNTDYLGGFFSDFHFFYYYVDGDTLIGTQSAKTIQVKEYIKRKAFWLSDNSVYDIHVSHSSSQLFVYSTQDAVYVYNPDFGRFTPLYVFNVNEGDTVCLPVLDGNLRPNPYAGGDTCFCFVIDSIRTVLYDTTYLVKP